MRTTIFIPIFAAVIALPLLFITPGSQLVMIGYDKYFVFITWEGIYKATCFTLRIWVCVASLTLLALTTKFSRLLHAVEKFKIPKFFIAMTAITYRFIFLFINEAYRMVLAKEARTTKKEGRLRIMRSLAHIISTLFIRAYERGERVYMAMTARGYTGEVKSINETRCGRRDWVFGFICVLACFTILLVEFCF
ncbi:MAG: cobalt ECF transporter T component CbiQ [Thermoproteota archaeon]